MKTQIVLLCLVGSVLGEGINTRTKRQTSAQINNFGQGQTLQQGQQQQQPGPNRADVAPLLFALQQNNRNQAVVRPTEFEASGGGDSGAYQADAADYSQFLNQEEQGRLQQQVASGDFTEALGLASGAFVIFGDIQSSFSCENQPYGYYADVDNNCQLFHVCNPVTYPDGISQTFQYTFMCGRGSVFNQEKLACDHPEFSIPCQESSSYFSVNDQFGVAGPSAQQAGGAAGGFSAGAGGARVSGGLAAGGGQQASGSFAAGGRQQSSGSFAAGGGQQASGSFAAGVGQVSGGLAAGGGQQASGSFAAGGGQVSGGFAAGGGQQGNGNFGAGGGQQTSGNFAAGGGGRQVGAIAGGAQSQNGFGAGGRTQFQAGFSGRTSGSTQYQGSASGYVPVYRKL